ncbi:glycosyltransferase family 4 protein [Coleofasciculus chthonoplastes]|uniref:glycosyltransferase family 4 protein n=1 Tax=Coleofasciculus chthonoplastes TaxID=64178 RepID=UPI0032F17FB8
MNKINDYRIAWLLPSLSRGVYWQPVLSEFTKRFNQTTIYTGDWSDFTPGFEGSFSVEVVGQTKFVKTELSQVGYSSGFSYVSPKIVSHLLNYKPHVIFAHSFSVWTLLAVLFKPLGGWKLIIAYDGSSPIIDRRNSKLHLLYRRIIVQMADALITNSQGGKDYLTEVLGARENSVFAQPYQVPNPKALLGQVEEAKLNLPQLQHPIFMFSGVVQVRKGLRFLLEACNILQRQGYQNYTLLIVGDGPQGKELKEFVKNQDLSDRVYWAGWVEYGKLGNYFHQADVFVFSTLEDIWGMVVLEAMAFGKPILCSKWAGVAEMVMEGENGYIFDPHNPQELAELMQRFLKNSTQIRSMGNKSQQLIAPHTPESVAEFLEEVTSFALGIS